MMETSPFTKKQMAGIFAGLMSSLLLYALDSTVVSTAMKAITEELNGAQFYSWPFTVYMLCSTVIIPVCGGISDSFGCKPVFLAGVSTFLLGSALCGLSPSMVALIVCRGIQGIGGGILLSSVFTAVAGLFPPRERGRYTGIVTSMFGVASIIGPFAGGLITDRLGWRWIFFLNLPLGLVAAFFIARCLPGSKPEERKATDLPGTAVLVGALLPLLLAFSMAGSFFDFRSVPFWSMISVSAVLLVLFGFLEAKSENPLVPPAYFKNRAISFSFLMAFLTQALLFAAILYLPYFVQTVLWSTATVSGAAIAPMMIGLLLASNLTGQLMSKTGKCRILSIVSFTLAAVGMFLLSTMNSTTGLPAVVLYAAITGFAVGGNMPISNVNAQNSVPKEKIGGVTSSVMFFKNLGRTVGSAVFGSILAGSMSSGLSCLNLSRFPQYVRGLLQNPEVLTHADAVRTMRAHIPPADENYFNLILHQSRAILVSSIDNVFKIGAIIALTGAFLMIFLKEAPKRKGPKKMDT